MRTTIHSNYTLYIMKNQVLLIFFYLFNKDFSQTFLSFCNFNEYIVNKGMFFPSFLIWELTMSTIRTSSDSCAAIIGSVTYATKAQRLLLENAIPASIGKVSGKSGCAYGVYYPCAHQTNVQSLFQKNGVRVKEYL